MLESLPSDLRNALGGKMREGLLRALIGLDDEVLFYDTFGPSLREAVHQGLNGAPQKLFEWIHHAEYGVPRSPRSDLNRKKSWWRVQHLVDVVRGGDRVLDAGCGIGTDALLTSTALGVRVEGVDVNERRLRIARARASHWSRVLGTQDVITRFQAMSVHNLDFDDDFFDVVWCNQAIEHIHPLEPFFREVTRVLKPEGWFLVANINALSPYAQFRMWRKRGLNFFKEGVIDPRTGKQIQYAVELLRSPSSIKRQLRRMAFHDLRVSYSGSIPSLLAAMPLLGSFLQTLDRALTRSPLGRLTAYDFVVVGRKGSGSST